MKRIFLLLFLVLFLQTGCVIEPCKPTKPFPIKIGLLADSQITSQNGFSNFHYRSKFADSLVDVSIRPPALECFLAEEMLQIGLNKLTQDSHGIKKGIDVILYLGDAANSGGADEIETVLTILDRHRAQTGIPIFILIGNHDYLGAGNITTPGTRFALLNRIGRPDNPALTKYEVLKKFSEFNHANNHLPSNTCFQYRDNKEALEQNKNRDHDTGLYLSGILTYKEQEEVCVDIFLLDSSDYKDAPDWSEVADLGIYGIIGSISFKDEPGLVSQTSFLKGVARSSSPPYRFLASHYPKDHLDRITLAKPGQVPLNVTNLAWGVTESAFSIPTFSKTLNQNLEPLLSSGGRNYWVTGHTHVSTMLSPDRFIVGGLTGDKYFTGLNIGSTTDYRAHVAIVERYEQNKNRRLDNWLGYREIPLFESNEILLTAVPAAIGDYGREQADDPNFQPLIPSLNTWSKEANDGGLLDIGSSLLGGLMKEKSKSEVDSYWIDVGAMILGLNKKYRQEAWGDPQTTAAAQHIRTFTDQFIRRTGSNREEVISLLGLLAGAYEKELLPGKYDLSPESLKKLAAFPK
ncbi:MAG: metallophosphoesterase [Sedimentisphaerales bacterium]|nr:metallophosphoesterase [Sedimentisphaerales bacterium]